MYGLDIYLQHFLHKYFGLSYTPRDVQFLGGYLFFQECKNLMLENELSILRQIYDRSTCDINDFLLTFVFYLRNCNTFSKTGIRKSLWSIYRRFDLYLSAGMIAYAIFLLKLSYSQVFISFIVISIGR